MNNKLNTITTSLLLMANLVGCGSDSQPKFVDSKKMLWTQTTDSLGNFYSLPDEVSWAVDPASCSGRVDELRSGFLASQKFWSSSKRVQIHEALPGDEINFVIYCAEFGKTIAQSPRAYRVKTIVVNQDNSIDKMEVEVPSNWKVVNDQLAEEGFTPMSYSAFGVAYNTLGLAMGMTHAYDPGRSSSQPNLYDYIVTSDCVKNCDT